MSDGGVAAQIAELAGPTDWEGFRHLARHAVAQRVAPQALAWRVAGAPAPDLFTSADTVWRAADMPAAPPLSLPPGFVALARVALLHDDPQRLDLLYRWVHRLAHDPVAWQDPLRPARVRLERLAQAVRREMHRMKAYVRFNRTGDGPHGEPLVAWFDPAHHVVEAVAPFFARRLGGLQWALLTPRGSVRCDGVVVHPAPAADASQRPAPDDGQALWLAYYQSIFNPARLNLPAMRRDMPLRLWSGLPETACVSELARSARPRTQAMVDAAPSVRRRRRPGSQVSSDESLSRG